MRSPCRLDRPDFPVRMLAWPDLVPGSGRPAGARLPMGPPRPGENTAPRRPRPRNPNGHQGQQARIQRNRVMDQAAPVFVGIDVSKHRLDIHLRPSGESFTIDHDDGSVAALIERLGALTPALIALEATCGCDLQVMRVSEILRASAKASENVSRCAGMLFRRRPSGSKPEGRGRHRLAAVVWRRPPLHSAVHVQLFALAYKREDSAARVTPWL